MGSKWVDRVSTLCTVRMTTQHNLTGAMGAVFHRVHEIDSRCEGAPDQVLWKGLYNGAAVSWRERERERNNSISKVIASK